MFGKTFRLNLFFVLMQLVLAWTAQMATTHQMNRLGYQRGVPALCHGGWWADLVIVGFTMGIMVERYLPQWRPKAIAYWLLASGVMTISANLTYLQMSKVVPNFTAVAGHLTLAGVVHLFYAWIVFGFGMLFWFETKRVVRRYHVYGIAFATLIHIVAGFVQPAHHVGDSLLAPGLLLPLVVVLLILMTGFFRLYRMRP
jgi:hypothetical protein